MLISAITSDVSSQINTINDHVNDLAQPWDASDRFTAGKGWKVNHLSCSKIDPWVLLTCELARTETWTCEAWKTSEMLELPDWLGAVHDTIIPAASNGSISQGGNLYVTVSRTHIDAFPAMDMQLPTNRWVSFSVAWFAAA